MSDRRNVLESILHSEDPQVHVADRLRALELLSRLDSEVGLEEFLHRETQRLPSEEVDRALDSGLAVIVSGILAGRGEEIAKDFPLTLRIVRDMLDRRAREIAHELRATEEPVYLPLREPEPIRSDETYDVKAIANERAEIGDDEGPWELLGRRWHSD